MQHLASGGIHGKQPILRAAAFPMPLRIATLNSSALSRAAFLLMALAFPLLQGCGKPAETPAPRDPRAVLRSVPIARLAVCDFTLDVITQAAEDQKGGAVLQISGGRIPEGGDGLQILYRGGVRVTCGVRLEALKDENIRVEGRNVTVTLPNPDLIDRPKVLNEGPYRSAVLDTKNDTSWWLFRKDTSGLEHLVREAYQREAGAWITRFGFDEVIKERVREVLRCLLGGDYTVEVNFSAKSSMPGDRDAK